MKYIIKNTDLFLNGKLIPEGKTVELSSHDSELLSDYLIEVQTETNDNIAKKEISKKKK